MCYYDFIMEGLRRNNFEIKKEIPSQREEILDVYDRIDSLEIDDYEGAKKILEEGLKGDEAEYFIEEMYNKGARPRISTLLEKKDIKIEEGFTAKSGWDPSVSVIAGTFGIDVYSGDLDENRISFKINIDLSRIKPRMTGPDNLFHGVVIMDGPVIGEEIEYEGVVH